MNKDLLLKELQELEQINAVLKYQIKLNENRLTEIDKELAGTIDDAIEADKAEEEEK